MAARGEPLTAADLVRGDVDRLVGDWRSACGVDGLGHGPAGGGGDEIGTDRARAVVAATGTTVFAALATVLDPSADLQRSDSPVARVADIMAENNVAIGQLVRQFSLLRQVLHDHVHSSLPAEVAGEAEHQLDVAVDALMEVCAARAALRLEQDAFVDPLTGLLNRRALDRDLSREIAVAERHGRRLSLLSADVDGLKKINDRQGHAMGDEALRALAGALRAALRGGDSAYRVGGDEFVVLLPEMGAEDVSSFVARVRSGAPPSFGWGAATFPDEVTNRPSLLDLADRRLLAYRQASGRTPAGLTSARIPTEMAMRAGGDTAPRKRRSILVATFLGGVLFGGAGLASAATGALPAPMQDVADTVLARVGVPVGRGTDEVVVKRAHRPTAPARFRGDADTPCTADGSPFEGTHGQYVAAHPDDPSTPENEAQIAAQSPCGKPVASADVPARRRAPMTPDSHGRAQDAGRPDHAGKPEGPGKPASTGEPPKAVKPADTAPTRQNRPVPARVTTTTADTTTTTTTTVPAADGTAVETSADDGPGQGRATDRKAPTDTPGGDNTGGGAGDKRGGSSKAANGQAGDVS